MQRQTTIGKSGVYYPYSQRVFRTDFQIIYHTENAERRPVDIYSTCGIEIPLINADVVPNEDIQMFPFLSELGMFVSREVPIQVMGDTVRIKPELLRVGQVVAFSYLGRLYFLYKPKEGVIELYERIEKSD